MDILKRLNAAVEYVENNLSGEIDIEEAAKLSLNTVDGFQRLFSYLTGFSITEYIRHRRLTLAALDLMDTKEKVIDIAVKYGYSSADAFCKAFKKQHGISPNQARTSATLNIYPPVSFHILVKGGKEMHFIILETDAIHLKGLSKQFTGEAADRFEQEHIMWADHHEDTVSKISSDIPGKWYGVWDSGKYSIARQPEATASGLDNVVIPRGTYAVFTTDCGGFAGDELPKLRGLIFGSWIESSGYRQTSDYEVEVYYLFPKDEKQKRHYEIWIPVERTAKEKEAI